MNIRNYVIVSAILFALVAVIHLARLFLGWDIIIDGKAIPMWVSVVGAGVAGFLSFAGFRVLQNIRTYLT